MFSHSQPRKRPNGVSRLALCALLMSSGVLAAPAAESGSVNRVTRQHSLEWGSTERLNIANGVGEIDIQLGEGDRIEVQVQIRGDRGWFGSRRDVSDIDIEIERRGDELRLALEEEKLSANWQIILPKRLLSELEINLGVGDLTIEALTSQLEIDLGVGEVDAQVPDSIIDIDVGVGDIEIVTHQANAGAVRASVGVGRVTIVGEGVDSSGRGVVRISAAGKGDKEIVAAAGVGDIDIRLE
jgi:hypothetical protein